jgi:hypothetical protein
MGCVKEDMHNPVVPRAYLALHVLAAVVLLGSGCAYFRPSQTEAERMQEEQAVAEREYLKGTFIDDLVRAAGNSLNH